MKTIKCKYCGKSYASPSEMRKRKCRSHPKGVWGGYCTPDKLDAFLWGQEKYNKSIDDDLRKIKENSERFKCEYKKHTPLIDLGRTWYTNHPSGIDLQIRESDLNQLALDMANGINDQSRDAINTVYALRAGCDYVLDNTDAQKEGSLNTWLGKIKQLKDEVISWDFWVALYCLTQLIKDKVNAAENDFETNRENWNYWRLNSVAELFHTRLVIPMLHAVNKKGDDKDKEVMNMVTSYIRKLQSKTNGEGYDSGKRRCVEKLSRKVTEYSFWGVLYCLYWIELRPTPWDDHKVWPIQASQKDAKEQDTPATRQATKSDKRSDSDKKSLEQKDDSEPLQELENLIGLGRVKDEVRKLVELVKFNAARKAKGLSVGGMTSHFVFTGNPGTGKTTVARIIAGIYRQLGILKKGHLVEVDRSKLVAGYVGHTAIQTNAVVDSAMDGVLFIDEAYSLVAGGKSDFGSEAIATLLKRMEDARERIIVIVAGYTDEMHRFVRSNPGLESRFTKFIEFPDYSIDELVSIFDNIVKKNQFTCSLKGHELARKTIEAAALDGHVSGNARYVRNLFDAVRERMARRVMKIENASMIQLQTIEAEDFGELVGGTSQQLVKPSAITNVKGEPAQDAAVENFSKSQYLKDLRGRTLGMHWSKVRNGNAANLSDKFGIHSDQVRVQSNLAYSLWNSTEEGMADGQKNYIGSSTFHIFHDGKSFQLKTWGEFWGNVPGDNGKLFHAIDFNSGEVKACLDSTLNSIRDAWSIFGVKGNSGCNPGNSIGGGNIWWHAFVPFKDHDELVSEEFSKKLRDSLAKVAAAFATLMPYRVSVEV